MSSDRIGCGNRLEGIQDILDGKFRIRKGLDELCKALKELRCGKEYEAQINIVNGIHNIKEGLRDIKEGLCELRCLIDRRDRKEIKEGIRDICCGLKILCCVLKDICCGRICEAEEGLVEAIKLIEKGLCKIEKALDSLCLC